MVSSWVRRETSTAVLLCTACGIADAIGYVYTGVFAANMTGNTVLAAISLANGDFVLALERAFTLVTFFGGAMLGRMLLRIAGSSYLPLLVEALLLILSSSLPHQDSMVIPLVACAMGIQATATTRFHGAAISTVVMTTTLARLAESTLDFLARHKVFARMSQSIPVALLLLTWTSYAAGAVLAVLLLKVTSVPLFASAVLVLAVSWSFRKQKVQIAGL